MRIVDHRSADGRSLQAEPHGALARNAQSGALLCWFARLNGVSFWRDPGPASRASARPDRPQCGACGARRRTGATPGMQAVRTLPYEDIGEGKNCADDEGLGTAVCDTHADAPEQREPRAPIGAARTTVARSCTNAPATSPTSSRVGIMSACSDPPRYALSVPAGCGVVSCRTRSAANTPPTVRISRG